MFYLGIVTEWVLIMNEEQTETMDKLIMKIFQLGLEASNDEKPDSCIEGELSVIKDEFNELIEEVSNG